MEPSSHRLPTVSASQALLGLSNNPSKFVPSGVRALDAVLAGGSRTGDSLPRGFERGKVTEIWGSNGAGKTAVALQAAANAIAGDGIVVWVDATKPLNQTRAESVLSGSSSPSQSPKISLSQLHHITVPTLSHLLAFLLRPSPDLIPSNTALLIITGINTLVDLDYPRYQTTAPQKTEQQKWQAGRRYAILGSLITTLNKLAVLKNLAVLVTTGCSMRMRSNCGLGSAIVPGVGGQEWDTGIWNRLVVFRDFGGRFIGVQKCNGKSFISREEIGEVGRIVSCEIDSRGVLRERSVKVSDDAATAPPPPKLKSSSVPKRTYDEIADSEDEDVDEYGWIDTDEHALAMESLVEETEQAPEKENQSR